MPAGTVSPSVLELLGWIARSPRTYGEAMEAWTTHCPRLTVWEDALEARLVAVVRNGHEGSSVALTAAGKAALDDASR